VFLFLRWGYDRDVGRIGDWVGWYFERKFNMVDPARARRAGLGLLLALAILFGCMAVLGITVGTGLIENADPPGHRTVEESARERGD